MNSLSLRSSGEINEPIIYNDTQYSPLEDKTDEISKKTGKSEKSSARKDINATVETKNPKVSNLAYQKILQQYQELPDEPDINEEGIKELFKALDKFHLPMNKDSAFYDTDLIIIDDAFPGNMPLNGIRKSDMEKLELLFNNICDGKTNIKIIGKGDNDLFKNNIENLIKKLLTRNIGRKLLKKVVENPSITCIDIMEGNETCISPISSTGYMKLSIDMNRKSRMLAHHPTGKIKSQFQPLYITLAHELVHASHGNDRVSSDPPTFSNKYGKLEEQFTITGLKRDIIFDENDLDSSWNGNNKIKKFFEEYYDELNEWNLTGAFTDSANVYYPRFSHKSHPFSDDIKVEIVNLVNDGLLFDLESLDENINIYELFKDRNPPLIFIAVESGDINMVRFLINKGFDLDARTGDGNALHNLFYNMGLLGFDYFDMVKFLIDNGISLHLPDSYGRTPLHQLICYERLKDLNKEENRRLVKLIISNIIKTFDLNILFDLIKDTNSTSEDKVKFGEIIWDCSYETLEQYLKESHNESEQEALYKRFIEIITKLTEIGTSTPIKETLSLENLLINSANTAWIIKLLSEKKLINNLGTYRTSDGDNLLHIVIEKINASQILDDGNMELFAYVKEKYPELLHVKNNSNITPQQLLNSIR